jgi:hypothetical protein
MADGHIAQKVGMPEGIEVNGEPEENKTML